MPKKKKANKRKSVGRDTAIILRQPKNNETPLPQPKAWKRNKKSSKIFASIFDDSQGMREGSPEGMSGYKGLSRLPMSYAAMPVNDPSLSYGYAVSGDSSSMFVGPAADASGHSLTASAGGTPSGGGLTINAGGNDVALTPPPFHTPGNAQDAFNLPKSYVEQIRWSRLMYNLNAYIGAITDLKAYYPLSKFRVTTAEPFVTEFYNQNAFNKGFNLYNFDLRLSLGLQKFGEGIAWGARKQDGTWPKTGKARWVWDYFIQLEPELVEIKKSLIGSSKPQFFMRPSRDLEELVKRMDDGDPEVVGYRDKIGDAIKEKIRKRDLVPLDPSTISAIQNLTDASAVRGTPPYQRLFNTFVLEDFTRLTQMAQANRYMFPIELWTLGDLEKNIMPNNIDLDNLRTLVTSAIQTPPFAIFFPPILKYEALQVTNNFPVKDSYEYIWRQYTVGMGVSEQILLGDSGIFSSTDTSSNQAFVRARKKERDQIEDWMTWNFFEPLARWNNLKIKKGSMLSPILPDYEWEKTLDYIAEERELETAKFLYKEGKYPTRRLLAKSRENPEQIEVELKNELDSIFDDGKRIAAPFIRNKKKDTGKNDEPLGPGTPVPENEEPEGGEAAAVGEGGGGGPGGEGPGGVGLGLAPAVEEAEGAPEAPEAAPEEAAKIL